MGSGGEETVEEDVNVEDIEETLEEETQDYSKITQVISRLIYQTKLLIVIISCFKNITVTHRHGGLDLKDTNGCVRYKFFKVKKMLFFRPKVVFILSVYLYDV